ncbi:hypothetical protein NAEGRDRAFT_79120 [Naegleria gruberi]|uniref:Uncharacterized protein n=1 Tax=Naegleria gruberi TaxID=5762 RepID=D2V954_NAEGR|nr:uncharacterized protein NAEGRDRAFT_79120 [Naegleria gruberi]EFC46528.1 hypothetical protein NAEGRDRAFT_79120 [Naegleria gruberi]|eukprot:XP_002679272.1 hypothetical protein NAEGRDRAFT_79120 [Naegleria gruberi strain NEG-M]
MTGTTDSMPRSATSGRFLVMILLVVVVCLMTTQSANCKKIDVFDVLVKYLRKPARKAKTMNAAKATDSCTLQCSSGSTGQHEYQKCVDLCKVQIPTKKRSSGNTELYDTLASKILKFSQFKKLIEGPENKTKEVSENCQKCLDVCIKDKRGPACYGQCGLKSYCTFEDISIAPNLLNFVN